MYAGEGGKDSSAGKFFSSLEEIEGQVDYSLNQCAD